MTLATRQDAEQRTARLRALQRYATRYEIAAILPDGTRYLLGYRRNLSKGHIMRLVGDRGPEIVRASYSRPDGWTFADGRIRIGRTGRTERQATLEGELTRIEEAS